MVDAGHFGGFATDEGATYFSTCFRHAAYDLFEGGGVHTGATVVVEEEEGAGSLAEDVIDAVIDDVLAEAAIVACHGGDFCFGSYAVDA